MSRRPPNNLGDLLAACQHTGAADEASVRVIARMLGLSLFDGRADLDSEEPPRRAGGTSTTPSGGEVSQEGKPPPSGPLSRTEHPPSETVPLSIIAVMEPGAVQPPPAWIGKRLPPSPAGGPRSRPLKLEPLFRPSWTRNLIASAVATSHPDGPLQLDVLVELLGARRPIRKIPRQLRSTVRAGAQVLVDRSETMEPFSRDVEHLLERIPAVVGRERAQVLFFESSPQQTGVGPRLDWQEHRFQPGVPILALTSLGINEAPHHAMATAQAWRTFAEAACDAGCPLVTLVPYPPSRWPAGLSESMVILEWDRGTTVGHARQLVRRRHRTS